MIVHRRGDEDDADEMEPRPALPVGDDHDSSDTEAEGSSQNLPATAEEYLRMVRRQARTIPDVVVAPGDGGRRRAGGDGSPGESRARNSSSQRRGHADDDVGACEDELLPPVEWESCYLQYFDALRTSVMESRAVIQHASAGSEGLPAGRDEDFWYLTWFGPDASPPSLRQVSLTDAKRVSELLWTFSRICESRHDADASLIRGIAEAGGGGAGGGPWGGAWLFALLVVTEKPADADTSAALRALVRYLCARRRELMTAQAEALPALNVLITILGSYFGQLPVRPDVYRVAGGWTGGREGRRESDGESGGDVEDEGVYEEEGAWGEEGNVESSSGVGYQDW